MTNNTDDEALNNPANTQPENPPEEITPARDIDTITPNQEPENMEVHHHPDIHHEKKKWKEYFFEFLMIFLAVAMGFFAEQIRERHVEKERLQNYSHQSSIEIIDLLDANGNSGGTKVIIHLPHN